MARNARAVNEALLLEALGFIFVALLIWVNEDLDLPHMLLGAPPTPWRPIEVAIESGFVLPLGTAVTGVSWLTFRRLVSRIAFDPVRRVSRVGDDGRWMPFETFVQSRDRTETTHEWCRRVAVDGDWISIDRFLQQRKNTTSSVGVCPDCYAKQIGRK